MGIFRKVLHGVRSVGQVEALSRSVAEAKILSAKLLIRDLRQRGTLARLAEAEFKVFSQFGDDGIIQYLIHLLAPLESRFIEFGVEDYTESNTRFLLVEANWRGLVIDGSAGNVARIRSSEEYWRHDLTAVAAFVNRDNVNALFRDNGFAGPIGLLSIDIDGNDYWVWEAIDAVEPAVVICEYNAAFGSARAVAVPYDAAFQRTAAHFSNLYWGASLKAFALLAARKGFALVGTNSAGNNAYFVRRDRMGPLRPLSAEEAFTGSRFRDSRDEAGRLTFLSGDARLRAIAGLPLVDVETNQMLRAGDLPRKP